MLRGVAAWLVGVLIAFGATLPSAPAATAVPAARATITFDVSTGQIFGQENAHARLRVASTIKLLTALVVRANVALDAPVLITARATQVPPLKLSMQAGSSWNANDLLHAMLIASLNDAATALALKAGDGSFAGYQKALTSESRRLGLVDDPRLKDPAGLDGSDGEDGGNLISAWDMAIITRAFLGDPLLAGIVRLPNYRFSGGDGKDHIVYNHNAFLNIYPGAIGVKTGYTELSGHSLVAAATRNGRTIATVVIGSDDPVGVATQALDAAFATPAQTVQSQSTSETLPARGLALRTFGAGKSGQRPLYLSATIRPTEPAQFPLWIVAVGGLVIVVAVAWTRARLRRP